jgi:hypothetical protein
MVQVLVFERERKKKLKRKGSRERRGLGGYAKASKEKLAETVESSTISQNHENFVE